LRDERGAVPFLVRFGVVAGVAEADCLGAGVATSGAVAGALLRQSRDVAGAIVGDVLVAPCALSEGRAHSLGLLQYTLALSPLIDTAQLWGGLAQILPLVMRTRWSLSLIFLDFMCVTMWIYRGSLR